MRHPYLPLLAAVSLCTIAPAAHADLCNEVQNKPTSIEAGREYILYTGLFPSSTYWGSDAYDRILADCNRDRDTLGNEVLASTGSALSNPAKDQLALWDLPAKPIRGFYNFWGLLVTQQRYMYVLSKVAGVWKMVIPYDASFDSPPGGTVDIDMGNRWFDGNGELLPNVDKGKHAWRLYEASQVSGGKLIVGAKSIAETLCATTTYLPGHVGAYAAQSDANASGRDLENQYIQKGKIQWGPNDKAYVSEGCRVLDYNALYWNDGSGTYTPVLPKDWILDNFVSTTQSYWTIPGVFELSVLIKDRNEGTIDPAMVNAIGTGDHMPVVFGTRFVEVERYKVTPIQGENFSSMTNDSTLRHEVGHAMGLDDEYANDINHENSCGHSDYASMLTGNYIMCTSSATLRRTFYNYLSTSRYITQQKDCEIDANCAVGKYCDLGLLTFGYNQCVAKKADNGTCDLLGGDHQCLSGKCKSGRCYTASSVSLGGLCFVNEACKSGQCSALNGLAGTCVCNDDGDCAAGKYCDSGVDLTKNSCKAKQADGGSCDFVGGGHQCLSGLCKYSHCYTPSSVLIGGSCWFDGACKSGKCSSAAGFLGSCVCDDDADCAAGKWCDAGLDFTANSCKAKLPNGATCGTAGSVGNDHKCLSGNCSGFPSYKCK